MDKPFFVIKFGGSQHIVKVGDQIEVNRIIGKVDEKIEIKDVYLLQASGEVEIGQPNLDYVVSAKILSHFKGDKVEVFKYKAKSRYRKTHGHRQSLTKLEILDIKSAKSKAKETTKVSAVKTTKKIKTAVKTKPKAKKLSK